jgi:hypothetical protein
MVKMAFLLGYTFGNPQVTVNVFFMGLKKHSKGEGDKKLQ